VIANALLVIGAILALSGAAGWVLWARERARRAASDEERRRATDELNRRLSELFSLQELSYILSESLQLERIIEQVVRYAVRFLDARGALVALQGDGDEPIRVAAADGTLTDLRGQAVPADDEGLVARSLGRERFELVRDSSGGPTRLLGDLEAGSAASVPLRAHGVVVGTLVVTDPRGGSFAPEDIRLLSTVATHAAVVIANARFFEMVRRAKEQWETAFDALSEGIAVVDEAGRMERANRALAELLGAPVPDLIGKHLGEALGRPEALMPLLDQARRGERPPPLVTRSEVLGRTLRVNAARIAGATPAHNVVVLVEDVTDQQALESQLIQSEKLAAVGQLVSGVAHELNNPLTSIAGLSEFLLEQKELGQKDRGHLKVIHEQADRAGRIVRNLLTFARKGPAERTHVDLNELLNRTLLLMSYDLRLKDIEVAKDLASDLPGVMGDRHALQQVVLNLLNNAAQAVADNPAGRPRTVAVRTWSDGQVHLRVVDSGPGIRPDVRGQLFTPFFTTKEPGQGTGLGLSISYSIVEAHGGHIVIEEPPEGGAAFRVDLPPAGPGARDAPAAPAVAAPARGRRSKAAAVPRAILVVDDDAAIQRVVQALFGREGHVVDVAHDAAHGFALVAERRYDLIIADGRVAGQGRLFVEELLDRDPGLKDRTLVATGDVRPTTERALERLGLRYVRKPFNLRDLRDEAARIWAAGAVP
jgi:two-component system NtrC family sensor kinase